MGTTPSEHMFMDYFDQAYRRIGGPEPMVNCSPEHIVANRMANDAMRALYENMKSEFESSTESFLDPEGRRITLDRGFLDDDDPIAFLVRDETSEWEIRILKIDCWCALEMRDADRYSVTKDRY